MRNCVVDGNYIFQKNLDDCLSCGKSTLTQKNAHANQECWFEKRF